MLKASRSVFITFIVLILNMTCLNAIECTDFGEFKSYGGHYYVLSGSKYTYAQAKQIAENNDAYLAIPNDSGENSFLASTFGTAWIGIYDPTQTQSSLCYYGSVCGTTASRFVTVKNTALTYTNWATSEPSNSVYEYDIIDGKQMVSPLGEHWVVIGANGQWGDFGNHASENNNPVQHKAIFEFDTKPICVNDSNVSDTLTEKKCTESIYNTGTTSSGTIVTDSSGNAVVTGTNSYTCQKDASNNEYCPAQLAPCDTTWGYDPGYSLAHSICDDGSAPINGLCKTTTKACDAVGGTWNGKGGCMVGVPAYTGGIMYSAVASSKMDLSAGKNYCSTLNENGYTGWRLPELSETTANGGCVPSASDWTRTNTTITDSATEYTGKAFWLGNSYKTDGTGARNFYVRCVRNNTYSTVGTGEVCNATLVITTVAPSCTNVSSDGYCYANPNTYYTYHCSSTANEYGETATAINSGGTTSTDPNPPANNCQTKSFTCVAASDRKCAYVNNAWQCSPFPCLGEDNLESSDTTAGATDSVDKGFATDGSCTGQIRLFNGKDKRCRSWDILFGLMGGGCCQKEKSGGSLGSVFASQCTDDEKLLSKYRKETNDKSVEVGEYCSKYLKLGFAKICTQKKKTYCVFNSKLARIIHQQGRPQLGIAWGSAKAPNCRGFTPEEFQKIDFSKLDLSEFYGDLQAKIQTTIDAKIGTTIQQKVQSFGVNIGGGSQ